MSLQKLKGILYLHRQEEERLKQQQQQQQQKEETLSDSKVDNQEL